MSNKDMLPKAATCAATGALITGYAEGFSTTITLPMANNRTVPLWAAGGAAAGAASLLADYTHDVLLPAWAPEDKFSNSTGAALALAAGGAGQMAVYSAYDPRILRELGYTRVASYGMAAEALGTYAYNNMVKPMMA